MKHWLHLLLKSVLTLGALIALAVAVDPAALLDSLQHTRWPWLIGAVLLLPLNLALDGWVWGRLLRVVDGSFSAREIGGAVLSGLALGFWTPARAGEYAGRSLYFTDADRWALSLTVFVQRMVDMAVGVIVGLTLFLGALWTGLLPPSLPWLTAAGIGLLTGLVLTVILLNPARSHRWARWLVPNATSITDRTAVLEHLTTRDGIAITSGTLARYFVFTGQFVCLGLALSPSASVFSLATAVGLTFYAKYLLPSLTVLDLGIREGAAVFFFELLGLGAAVGLNAALLLFTINVLVPAAVGLPFVSQLSLPTLTKNGMLLRLRSVLPGR